MRPGQSAIPGPRRHHYLPQFYLAGFTSDGTREGQLHLMSLRDGRQWHGTPASVGHQRDSYRIEGVDGIDPNELERMFSDLEAAGASAIRSIVETSRLPNDREQYSLLINFIALMAARVPQMRENLGRPLRQVYENIWRIQLSSRERSDHLLAQARADGLQIPAVDYDTLRDAFEKDRIRLEVTQGQHLLTLLTIASTLVELLAYRQWTVLQAGEEEFITSDFPVSLSWTVPRPPSIYGPGFGLSGTDVVFPLTNAMALLGRLERGGGSVGLDRRGVASVNSRTLMYAGRIGISGREDFVWETEGNVVGVAGDLSQRLQAQPRDDNDG